MLRSKTLQKVELHLFFSRMQQMSSNETAYSLFQKCCQTHTLKQIATSLNLCVGTVNRWQELKDVPSHYKFDLWKLLGIPITYSEFTSTEKDQFFTPDSLVTHCWDRFQELVTLPLDEYTFIEPSAGNGSFLKVLPANTIALDIEPRKQGILTQDYLSWSPPPGKYIVFGNPPFGLRGQLALKFLNHSYAFAEYVCFILPQLFESDGKGSPRKRVQGYNLIHSEKLTGLYATPSEEKIKINGVFQIWSKLGKNSAYQLQTIDEKAIKIYSMSNGGTIATTRNKDMIGKCDLYLPSTCFGKEAMRLYNSFEELPGKKGYGIVFKTNKEGFTKKAKEIDWAAASFLSTNSAYNLRTSIIYKQLI